MNSSSRKSHSHHFQTCSPLRRSPRLAALHAKNQSLLELFHQWEALVERENKAEYSIQSIPSSIQTQRMKFLEMYYTIIDHYSIDRNVVSTAIFYFDRYTSHMLEQKLVVMASMTCIYLATKIHSNKIISASTMASMSSGYVTEFDILTMELEILNNLEWHLHPPIPAMFFNVISPIIDNFPIEISKVQDLKCLVQYLIELSAYFPLENPSSTLYAAMIVAMDKLSIPNAWLESLHLTHTQNTTDIWIKRLNQVHSLPINEIDSSLWLQIT